MSVSLRLDQLLLRLRLRLLLQLLHLRSLLRDLLLRLLESGAHCCDLLRVDLLRHDEEVGEANRSDR